MATARAEERLARRQTQKARLAEAGRAKQEGREAKLSSKKARRVKKKQEQERISALELARHHVLGAQGYGGGGPQGPVEGLQAAGPGEDGILTHPVEPRSVCAPGPGAHGRGARPRLQRPGRRRLGRRRARCTPA
eukprot:6183710-Prymnesium_polylepis.1